ncbi:MAG: hypothetical protein KF726_24080 [Anaerolineae bacterium]|nr:hypothetical protein [Anaerolineae bacterium]
MALIAVDVGSTSLKGAVLDLDAQRIDHARRVAFPAPIRSGSPLFREYDPQQILSDVHGLIRELAGLAKPCEGLVMCNQMHGLVFTTAIGEPRSTLTTWQDQRVLMPHPSGAGTYFDVLMSRLNDEDKRRLGGNELRVGLPIGNLFWLSERGELPADLIPAALPDFILANLCGTLPTTEVINAQSHGLLDLETMDWHHGVLRKLGLAGLRLPKIVPHGEVVGVMEIDGQRIPCYTPVGDFQCALLGALVQDGELSLNISTGSQVSLLRRKLEFGNFQTRPFFDKRYAITVTTIPAGRSLSALVKLLTELAEAQQVQLADVWGYISQQAEAIADVEMQVDLSFFKSAVGSVGSITNIREEELTIGHLFRAAFHNMAENYYHCAARLSPTPIWKRLVFSGGLAQKIKPLRTLITQKFNAPFRLAPHEEDTLFGLLALGLAFTKRTANVEEAAAQLSALSSLI